MKLTSLLIAIVSLVLVAGVVVWEWNHKTSPGPLNPTHQLVAELRGAAGCIKCHGQTADAMASACASCHADVKKQIDLRQGLHGSLDRVAALACASCHTEHTGSNIRLVSDQSFKAAGVLDAEKFDHGKVCKFALMGEHATLKCEQCHKNARAPELIAGQTRFTGVSQQCVSCHKDPHLGAFGADCASCHGQTTAFKKAPEFKHTSRFPLTGAHAIADCGKCHEKTGPTSVALLHGGSFTIRACVACHNDPHKGSYGQDCASCHGTSKPFNQVPLFKHTRSFPLVGGHAGLACVQCHATTGPHSIASLERTPTSVRTCSECHVSPHRKSLIALVSTVTHRSEDQSCTVCHRNGQKTFLSPTAKMTPPFHKATGFPLDAPHDKVQCVACHSGMGTRKPLVRNAMFVSRFQAIFPGRAPEDCGTCHKDPHAGQFNSGPTRGACIACHAMTHFEPSAFGIVHHEQTNFALTGAHKAVACSMCHPKQNGIVRFAGTATACSACHTDVHHGKFDQPVAALASPSAAGCAQCHNTASFFNVSWTPRDHLESTGYALKGAHATAACTDCHKPKASSGTRKMMWGAAPTSCAACHVDVHGGQFARQNVTDCARCHSDAGKFRQTTFDHQRDSAFKLDERHINLACGACHRAVEVSPGLRVVRYRPLGARCVDCHGSATPSTAEGK